MVGRKVIVVTVRSTHPVSYDEDVGVLFPCAESSVHTTSSVMVPGFTGISGVCL